MSLNEIELLVRRAALGRGLPYGLAEEAGTAAGWLAAAGLDRGEAIADALGGVLQGCAGRGTGCPCWQGPADAPSAVLCVGPSILDRLALPGAEALTVRLDVPIVLVGMIGARADQHEGMIRARFAAGPDRPVRVLLDAGIIMVDAPDPGTLAETRDAFVTVAPGIGDLEVDECRVVFASAHLERNRRRAIEQGVTLLPDAVRRLGSYAALSLVPSSEVSRERGAGAGIVDQD